MGPSLRLGLSWRTIRQRSWLPFFFMVVYSLRTSVEWERTNHPGEYPGIQRHHSRYRYRVDSSVDQDTKTSRVGFSSAHFKLLNIKKIVWFIILFRSAGKECET